MENIDLFEKEGLTVIKNIFNKKKIQELRNSLENSFKNKNNPKILNIYELDNKNEILDDVYLNHNLIKNLFNIY